MLKTLVLDANYRPNSFIGFTKLIRLFFNEKIEIISSWDEVFYKNIKLPAIVRLKKFIKTKQFKVKYSFAGVYKRDGFVCQYTGKHLTKAEATIDHVFPKKLGGKSTWENTVAATRYINRFKGSRTIEELGLELLRKPFVPKDSVSLEYSYLKESQPIHPDWNDYFEI